MTNIETKMKELIRLQEVALRPIQGRAEYFEYYKATTEWMPILLRMVHKLAANQITQKIKEDMLREFWEGSSDLGEPQGLFGSGDFEK